jgi:hypothetical protein
MTVMVINKVLTGSTSVSLNITHFAASGSAKVYRLTSGNAIRALPNKSWSGGTLSDTAPAQSITLYILPK